MKKLSGEVHESVSADTLERLQDLAYMASHRASLAYTASGCAPEAGAAA